MEYIITITEHLQKTVRVEADTREEALSKVETKYADGDIILYGEDFVDFEMEVKDA